MRGSATFTVGGTLVKPDGPVLRGRIRGWAKWGPLFRVAYSMRYMRPERLAGRLAPSVPGQRSSRRTSSPASCCGPIFDCGASLASGCFHGMTEFSPTPCRAALYPIIATRAGCAPGRTVTRDNCRTDRQRPLGGGSNLGIVGHRGSGPGRARRAVTYPGARRSGLHGGRRSWPDRADRVGHGAR
jgi:hypothetical protein